MGGIAPLKPGQDVLLLGTGGVSILALQFAKAGGARIIITSSQRLEAGAGLQGLGASELINYKEIEAWGEEAAKRLPGGIGKVIEVGGFGTLPQSMQAVGFGGEIAMIGVLTRGESTPHPFTFKGAEPARIMARQPRNGRSSSTARSRRRTSTR